MPSLSDLSLNNLTYDIVNDRITYTIKNTGGITAFNVSHAISTTANEFPSNYIGRWWQPNYPPESVNVGGDPVSVSYQFYNDRDGGLYQASADVSGYYWQEEKSSHQSAGLVVPSLPDLSFNNFEYNESTNKLSFKITHTGVTNTNKSIMAMAASGYTNIHVNPQESHSHLIYEFDDDGMSRWEIADVYWGELPTPLQPGDTFVGVHTLSSFDWERIPGEYGIKHRWEAIDGEQLRRVDWDTYGRTYFFDELVNVPSIDEILAKFTASRAEVTSSLAAGAVIGNSGRQLLYNITNTSTTPLHIDWDLSKIHRFAQSFDDDDGYSVGEERTDYAEWQEIVTNNAGSYVEYYDVSGNWESLHCQP